MPAGRSLTAEDFTDLTAAAVLSVGFGDEGLLEVTFDGDLSPAERVAVRVRIVAPDGMEPVLRRIVQSVKAGRAYRDLTAPTAAQVRQQVDVLTDLMTDMARVLVQDIDDNGGA